VNKTDEVKGRALLFFVNEKEINFSNKDVQTSFKGL